MSSETETLRTEEEKLVAFFRSKEGDALGRAGNYDHFTPAETAIRAMRTLTALTAERDRLRFERDRMYELYGDDIQDMIRAEISRLKGEGSDHE